MKNKKDMMKVILVALLLFIGIIIYRAVGWTNDHFSGLSFAQIIFHLKVPLTGTDDTFILSFMERVVYPALKITTLFLLINLIYLKLQTQINLNFVLFPKSEEKKHVKLNLFPGMASLIPVTVMALILIGIAINDANTYFSFYGYLGAQFTQSNFIEENFVEADEILTFPEEKRNLIYLYLESMENTFGSRDDGGGFKENYMPELTDLSRENVTFSHTENVLGGNAPTEGTGWTMAAMFSHSTGLPLKVPVQGNSMSEFADFFPGVISMGEILQEEGYDNYLMLGSDATFGGRRNFFDQHGRYEILDYHRAIFDGIIPEDYLEWWGLEDQKLYAWAKDKLTEISKKDEPFNFTMLTVDTHHEDGYVCELCQDEFDSQYANVIACASRQAEDFVQWIKDQDFYENTTMVIVGDHPTMDSNFTDDMDEGYLRTSYNVFINSSVEAPIARLRSRQFYSFDLLPTTLASLGVGIEGDRWALGTNLFSQEKTLLEEFGEDMDANLTLKSRFYDKKFIYPKSLTER